MLFDGDILQIERDVDSEQLDAFRKFVATRLEYIDEIRIEGGSVATPPQRLLQLLASIKKSRPQIRIALLDANSHTSEDGTAGWCFS